MKIGAAIFFTDYSIKPVELGLAMEERGFESLWAPEHSHIPADRKTAFPAGGELPKKYHDTMDPFVTLTAAAAVTTNLKIGTAICLVVQRDPIQTAKSVASLDKLSNGRFQFGVGAGWNAEEMANHGTVFKTRFSMMRERIEAMRVIWTTDVSTYEGQFVSFSEIIAWPKPTQKPNPPILMGGAFPFGAKRAVEYADGWFPHARRPTYGQVISKFSEFRHMVAENGRDPDDIPITVYGIDEDLDLLKRYRDAGTERVLFELPSAGADEVIPILDRCAEFMNQLS